MAPVTSRLKWVVLYIRFLFKVPFIRVPYYVGDLKRDPNLGNYPNKGLLGYMLYGYNSLLCQ